MSFSQWRKSVCRRSLGGRSSLASVRSLSAAQRGRVWPSSRSPDQSNRAGRSATVLSQFSRPPRERDDLFTLVVEQVRVNQREGGRSLIEKNAIVFPRAPRPGGVDLSPAPQRRATTSLSAVALGQRFRYFPHCVSFSTPIVQTSCTASPRLATCVYRKLYPGLLSEESAKLAR
jgi:hypothetical protein